MHQAIASPFPFFPLPYKTYLLNKKQTKNLAYYSLRKKSYFMDFIYGYGSLITSRLQTQEVPRSSCYSFDQPGKGDRLSRLCGLNPGIPGLVIQCPNYLAIVHKECSHFS